MADRGRALCDEVSWLLKKNLFLFSVSVEKVASGAKLDLGPFVAWRRE